MPNSGKPLKDQIHEIKCSDKTHPADTPPPNGNPWSNCDYKQFCAKIAAVSRRRHRLKRHRGAAGGGKTKKATRLRKDGNDYAKAFRDRWNEKLKPASIRKKYFYDDCAYKEADNGKDVSAFSPDHIAEIQIGGTPSSAKNIKWLKKYVNESAGGHLQTYKPPQKIDADCCPA